MSRWYVDIVSIIKKDWYLSHCKTLSKFDKHTAIVFSVNFHRGEWFWTTLSCCFINSITQWTSAGTSTLKALTAFNISFKAATIDLNSDKIDEVLVDYKAPNFCGSGGCNSYILGQLEGGSGWEILGQFFPGHEPSISSSQYNRYSDIVYNGRDNSYRCMFKGDRYDCWWPP